MDKLKDIRLLIAEALVSLTDNDDPVYAADILCKVDEMLFAIINQKTAPEDEHGPIRFEFD